MNFNFLIMKKKMSSYKNYFISVSFSDFYVAATVIVLVEWLQVLLLVLLYFQAVILTIVFFFKGE